MPNRHGIFREFPSESLLISSLGRVSQIIEEDWTSYLLLFTPRFLNDFSSRMGTTSCQLTLSIAYIVGEVSCSFAEVRRETSGLEKSSALNDLMNI